MLYLNKVFNINLLIFGICFIMIPIYQLRSQTVTVSPEVNIRSNYAYDILPLSCGNTLIYHDRGSNLEFDVFDTNMRFLWNKSLTFEKRNFQVICALARDTVVHVYYQYRDEGILWTKVKAYNRYGEEADTSKTLFQEKIQTTDKVRFVVSEDKSKVGFFRPDGKNLQLWVVDYPSDRCILQTLVSLRDFNFRTDFQKILINNKGQVFVLGRKERLWSRAASQRLMLGKILQENQFVTTGLNITEVEFGQSDMQFDHINNKIVLGGLVSKGNADASGGYFSVQVSPEGIEEELYVNFQLFSQDFISEVYGKKISKSKEINSLFVKELIVRQDGGIVLINEVRKEFLRRAQSAAPGRFGDFYSGRGFIDYYYEDIILMATYPDGQEHWKQFLYKKQFSQDDDGMYSSFFIFKTPSQIRFLYNDEIKNNNTVSEYAINPLGHAERRSVLSTEYQNLKLRFKDAIQTGPSSLIVPSEKSYKVNLVRISFD